MTEIVTTVEKSHNLRPPSSSSCTPADSHAIFSSNSLSRMTKMIAIEMNVIPFRDKCPQNFNGSIHKITTKFASVFRIVWDDFSYNVSLA